MTARRWLVLLALGLGACPDGGGGGDGDGPDTEWLSEGSGEANAAPLMPLVPGMTWGGAFGHAVADAVVVDGDARLLRVQLVTHPVGLAEEHRSLLFGRGADGVLFHGNEGAPLARPALLVPDTVRVGMRWRARVPGQATVEYEVVGRELELTSLGPTVVWSLRESDAATGATLADFAFQEGAGLRRLAGAAFEAVVVPMTGDLDDGPVAPELPATPLEPFGVGSPDFVENLFAVDVSAVIGAEGPPGLLILKGLRACSEGLCQESACFDLFRSSAEVTFAPPRVDTYHVGPGCVEQRLTDSGDPGAETGTLVVTSHASGALVLPTGIHWVPRNWHGRSRAVGLRTYPPAVYVDPASGDFRMLTDDGDGQNVITRATWSEYYHETSSFDELAPDLIGQWMYRGLGLPDRVANLGPPAQAVELAALTAQGLLSWSVLEGDVLGDLELVGTVGGAVSFSSGLDGQRLLVASAGGRIDRIVRDPAGGLAREAVARVVPPQGETVVAAIDLGSLADDRVLVATFRPSAPGAPLDLGRLSFHRTSRQPPVRWAWPAASGVRAASRGLDVLVCWPRSAAPFDAAGWTLGGVAPRQVLEAVPGRCALVVRDVDVDPVLQGQSLVGLSSGDQQQRFAALRWDVEGPVPGVGRARVGLGPGIGTGTDSAALFEEVAPLTGGGYATVGRLFGPGGVELGVPPDAFAPGRGVVDLSGAGVWATGGGPLNEQPTAFLYGPQSRAVALPATTSAQAPRFADPKGGVILSLGAAQVHVAPDGTLTSLPPGPWTLRRRSGDLCGMDGADVVCADATTGTETARTTLGDFSEIELLLPDDALLVSVRQPDGVTNRLHRWVPGGPPSAEVWDPRTIWTFTPALDGQVYCVLRDEDTGVHTGGLCGADGFQDLGLYPLLEKTSYLAANLYRNVHRVTAGADALWVVTEGTGSRFSTRLPWPPAP